jgi:branched-subunit amino acid ABC-type transport system permease component
MSWNLVMPDLGFGLVTASILAIGAVGFTMQVGVTKVINFAYGDQMTLAAYLIWLLNTALHWNVWVAAAAGALFMGVFSVLMGRYVVGPFARVNASPFTLFVATLAFGLVIENIIQMVWGAAFQSLNVALPTTYTFLGMILTDQELVIFGITVVTLVILHVILQYTSVGIAMRAMADNTALARTCGIRTALISDLTWFITGLLAGMAGFVLVLNVGSFGPTIGFGFLLVIVSAAILGGVGRPYGAMLGALVVGVATELSVLILPAEDKTAVALVVLILVLLIQPQGIAAMMRRS